jgi:hypothetical protein
MATFSGRVMVPKVQSGAEVRVRPSRVLRASADAMASGSGSSCMRMSTRSASAKCSRIRSTRARPQARSSAGRMSDSPRVPSGTVVAPGTARPSSVTASTGPSGKASRAAATARARRDGGAAAITAPRWCFAAFR